MLLGNSEQEEVQLMALNSVGRKRPASMVKKIWKYINTHEESEVRGLSVHLSPSARAAFNDLAISHWAPLTGEGQGREWLRFQGPYTDRARLNVCHVLCAVGAVR